MLEAYEPQPTLRSAKQYLLKEWKMRLLKTSDVGLQNPLKVQRLKQNEGLGMTLEYNADQLS